MRLFIYCILFLVPMLQYGQDSWNWETLETEGEPTARHEAAFVAHKDKLYLIGGRRINTTSVFDTKTGKWEEKSATPIELHHFQPVVVGDAIYLMGAMTGQYPAEKPLERVVIYYPEKDEFVYGDEIPESRRRGGAGVVYTNGKIYMVGGIVNGHLNGYKPWLDEYDPATGEWKVLPNAPNARDHFQAAALDGKIYAFAGRQSSVATNNIFNLTIAHGNVYDIAKGRWEPVSEELSIPTQRAGNSIIAWGDEIVVAGGESGNQVEAHDEVEAFQICTRKWKKWPKLNRGRHGSGLAIVGDYLYTASGCGNRGGSPELTSIERLKLPAAQPAAPLVFQKFHKVELDFRGPALSESSDVNPFTDVELQVTFTHESGDVKRIRGFYAADGKAAETSADAGDVWRVRFAPEKEGTWSYTALLSGESIGAGSFVVARSDKEAPDLRAIGVLRAENSYFKGEKNYWLKAGTNSPENLLGYEDIDGTYRIQAAAREGEAAPPTEMHKYERHLKDWKAGNPTWQGGKGKALIGALNYLAGKGMNSVYFLTMNIGGDGKDVWPYVAPDNFTRFDVSKLAQWEILFSHMQELGLACHVVIQETENERLLDNGDTGPERQLYFKELISRFGHHPGLIWNLGEENGYAEWTPDAQDTKQRKAMVDFLTGNDPYNHPILLHTHSHELERADILSEIIDHPGLDGLSLQADVRQGAPGVVQEWKEKSARKGNEWLITMDEIGKWHTGVLTDAEDPGHKTIRRFAIWGTLMAGGAGVENYFGAHSEVNDLGTEEWYSRDELWTLTNNARSFFAEHLPFWDMEPMHNLVGVDSAYCLSKPGSIYAIYAPEGGDVKIDLTKDPEEYSVMWYSVVDGGDLQAGNVTSVKGGTEVDLGSAPSRKEEDWVILLKRVAEK